MGKEENRNAVNILEERQLAQGVMQIRQEGQLWNMRSN